MVRRVRSRRRNFKRLLRWLSPLVALGVPRFRRSLGMWLGGPRDPGSCDAG